MTDKVYTVKDANDLLPYLAPALVELREKYDAAQSLRADVARRSAGNGHGHGDDASTTLERVSELIERIASWNIELRDVEAGLVDFPGVLDGEEVWLCWRLGEPEVGFWHGRDEGFASRRPLP